MEIKTLSEQNSLTGCVFFIVKYVFNSLKLFNYELL